MSEQSRVGRLAEGPADARAAAARLLWIGLAGTAVDEEAARLIAAGASGVVLFAHNISGATQLRNLIADLRGRARGGLRVAIDHEGGHIVRIGSPLTRFPSAMAVGATGSAKLAEAAALAAGRELRWLGVDVNLAPVLDVAADPRNPSIGVRSFGSSPELVARLGAAAIRGYRAAGVMPTAKHFPGHGRTPVDSHVDLPVLPGGVEELQATDLVPFKAAVGAGVPIVMVSHVAVEALTDGLPSSIAPGVMRGLLREELGFKGVVVTDAMNMGAISEQYGIADACVRALVAGADVVVPLVEHAETVAAIEAAIDSGVLEEPRLVDAVRRSEDFGRGQRDRALHLGREPLGGELLAEHQAVARSVAERSLTLVAGPGPIPLGASASVAVVEFPNRRSSPVEEWTAPPPSLGAVLRRLVPRTAEALIDDGPSTGSRAAALRAVQAAEVVVLATRDAYRSPQDAALIEDVLNTGRPAILVALRNPYDIAALPRTQAAIAAYADVPVTLEALASALTGRAGFPGQLPMELGAA